MFHISILALSASNREAITIGVVAAVVGGLIVAVLFELIRDRLMKAIRAAPRAIYKAMNTNVSKPIVLIPVVVISVFIAVLLLRTMGAHLIV